MIKKISLFALALALLLGMASCGAPRTAGSGTSASSSSNAGSGAQGLVGGLLSSLVGNAIPLTKDKILGTWVYSSPDCRFTSDNALAQAGGEVAATTVEQKLADMYAKVGISETTFAVQFNDDNSCAVQIGGRVISGTYTLNTETRKLSINSSTGLIKLSATVYYSLGQLTILFEADKLLSTVKMLSAFTGKGNSTIAAASSILDNYKGMMIGMNLTPYKQ